MNEYICKEVPEGFGCSVRTGYEIVKKLVRCKDCKYRSYYCTEAIDGTTLFTCHHPCANDVARPADWFCADGERKDALNEE